MKAEICEKCSKPILISDWPFCEPDGSGHKPAKGGNASKFPAVVIHVAKDGSVRFPGRGEARLPKGYERRELTTTRQVRQFEHQINEREKAKMARNIETEERFYEQEEKQNRSDLLQAMQSMSPLGRDIAREAIEANNRRGKKVQDPGFHLEAFHYNEANLPYEA